MSQDNLSHGWANGARAEATVVAARMWAACVLNPMPSGSYDEPGVEEEEKALREEGSVRKMVEADDLDGLLVWARKAQNLSDKMHKKLAPGRVEARIEEDDGNGVVTLTWWGQWTRNRYVQVQIWTTGPTGLMCRLTWDTGTGTESSYLSLPSAVVGNADDWDFGPIEG